jgi:hypothetical protein
MLMISVVLAKNGMEGEKFKKDIIYWYSWCNDALQGWFTP